MIGRLRGLLVEKNTPEIIVECYGVGYDVSVPLSTFYNLPALNQEVCLLIHHVVREDAQLLYGFATVLERGLFRALIKVNGVGPKLGLTILSGMAPAEFISLVLAGDAHALVKLPGVGKKTAERLVVEMQDTVKKLGVDVVNVTLPIEEQSPEIVLNNLVADAESALIALGYKPAEAAKAVSIAGTDDVKTVEQLIKAALKALTK